MEKMIWLERDDDNDDEMKEAKNMMEKFLKACVNGDLDVVKDTIRFGVRFFQFQFTNSTSLKSSIKSQHSSNA